MYTLRREQCDFDVFLKALEKTTEKRGSQNILVDCKEIISDIKVSKELNDFWAKYQNNFDYAKEISFDDTCNTISKIMDVITKRIV